MNDGWSYEYGSSRTDNSDQLSLRMRSRVVAGTVVVEVMAIQVTDEAVEHLNLVHLADPVPLTSLAGKFCFVEEVSELARQSN